MKILYSDEHIVVCEKDVGILSQADKKGSENMISLLKDKLSCDIYLIHRLDRNVGGVMVFAKTKASAGKMTELISDKEKFLKEYLAVAQGETEESGIYKDLIFKSTKDNKAYIVKKERKGVKEGTLDFKRLDVEETPSGPFSLVKVKLHTGRFHQIRVQFAERKTPLAGDGKYGSKDNKCDVALWSHCIGFKHPFTGENLLFTSSPDTEKYPWNLFKESINN